MGSTILLPAFVTPFKCLLKMKVVIVSCLVLSLAGLSQEFLGLKLGFLKGAVAGVKKSQLKSSQQQNCRSVQETVYETVSSQQCTKKPVQDCRQQQETTYEEVTRQQCQDVTEQSCQDVQDRQCQTVRKPVQETDYQQDCRT